MIFKEMIDNCIKSSEPSYEETSSPFVFFFSTVLFITAIALIFKVVLSNRKKSVERVWMFGFYVQFEQRSSITELATFLRRSTLIAGSARFRTAVSSGSGANPTGEGLPAGSGVYPAPGRTHAAYVPMGTRETRLTTVIIYS